ncbi:MAG: hypothetical protein OXI64_11750 [Defluviicoccus sp.]|nr:hypothetical protein [Defluviicoccus sp.]
MDKLTKRALWNAVSVVEKLEPGQSISREDLVDALRRPLPDITPGDAVIHHAYRHHILRAGVRNAEDVVTYEQAAALAGTTVEAIRQAAYRGRLVKLGVYRHGREWSGVTLRSIAEWRRWTDAEFKAAAAKVKTLVD